MNFQHIQLIMSIVAAIAFTCFAIQLPSLLDSCRNCEIEYQNCSKPQAVNFGYLNITTPSSSQNSTG